MLKIWMTFIAGSKESKATKEGHGITPQIVHISIHRELMRKSPCNSWRPLSRPRRMTKVRRPWFASFVKSRKLLVIIIAPIKMVDGIAVIR